MDKDKRQVVQGKRHKKAATATAAPAAGLVALPLLRIAPLNPQSKRRGVRRMVRVPNPPPSKRKWIKINGKKVKASTIVRPPPTPAPPPPPSWYRPPCHCCCCNSRR